MKELLWFIDRVGKRIYRDSNKCTCVTCMATTLNGLVIYSTDHAQYVFDSQNESASEGIFLNYRDTKEKEKVEKWRIEKILKDRILNVGNGNCSFIGTPDEILQEIYSLLKI